MWTVILLLLLIVSLSKWAIYRLSLMAVLLYYAESGSELPDKGTIQKYQTKVFWKSLGINEKKNTL